MESTSKRICGRGLTFLRRRARSSSDAAQNFGTSGRRLAKANTWPRSLPVTGGLDVPSLLDEIRKRIEDFSDQKPGDDVGSVTLIVNFSEKQPASDGKGFA